MPTPNKTTLSKVYCTRTAAHAAVNARLTTSVAPLQSKVFRQHDAASRQSRGHLKVQSNYMWGLAKHSGPNQLSGYLVDLTESLKTKKKCAVGSKDYTSEAIDFTILDHGGAHLVFGCEGQHAVEQPNDLCVSNVDSECTVKVDGDELTKGSKKKLHPGAVVEIGDAKFVVLRNVLAHA